MADLKLDALTVVHAGQQTWRMSEVVQAVAARHLLAEVRPLATSGTEPTPV